MTIDDDEEEIFVAKHLGYKLKTHQVDGVRFMWENSVVSVKAVNRKNSTGFGCILAHKMGLGKTLQVSFSLFFIVVIASFSRNVCVVE